MQGYSAAVDGDDPWMLFEAVGSRMQSLPEMPIGFNIVHFVVFSALHVEYIC